MKAILLNFLVIVCFSVKLMAQTSHSFEHNGTNRTFIVYVPDGLNPDEPPSLLLALHGFTQNGSTIMQYSGFNNLANTDGFIVAYPYGLNTSWNVGQSGADDVGFLLALTDTLHNWHNIDLNRIYATGFSNGGFMSYRLACEASDRIAAIAAVAGTMPIAIANSCQPLRPVPVLHIHGTADFIVPYAGSSSFLSVDESLEYWRNNNTCNMEAQVIDLPDIVQEGSTVQQFIWNNCDDESQVQLLKVVGGGHTWPGYDGFMGIGNTNMDIDASAMIWEFLSQFSLPVPTHTNRSAAAGMQAPYPNPLTGNTLFVPASYSCQSVKIILTSSDGKVVFEKQIAGHANLELDITSLISDFYLLRLDCGEKSMVYKIIKLP